MNTKRRVTKSFIGLIAGGLFLAGCTGPTTLDQNWGRSVETVRYNQTLNPAAGQNAAPVEGLDGASAEQIIETYRHSFTKEEKASGYDIKLTGIGTKN